MQVKKFVAADMRRALDMVRVTLGPEAIILSTTRQKKGIEVMAAVEEDVIKEQTAIAPITQEETLLSSDQSYDDLMVRQQATSQYQATLSPRESDSQSKGVASGKTQDELAAELERARQRMMDNRKRESMTIVDWADQMAPSATPPTQVEQAHAANANADSYAPQPVVNTPVSQAANTAQQPQYDKDINALRDEITSLRSLLESQVSSAPVAPAVAPVNNAPLAHHRDDNYRADNRVDNYRAPQEIALQEKLAKAEIIPFKSSIGKRFTRLGLQPKTVQQLLSNLTQSSKQRPMTKEELWPEALAKLAHSIPVNTDDPVAKGGIFALLGPTGVGKTTTVAKLAARHVLTQGAQEVALVTTDTYRIAAYDQLRSLGRILNVSVTVVEDLSDLPRVISELSHHKLILLDTPGMNHSDPLLADHLSAIEKVPGMRPLLALSANSQYQMMKASVHAYQKIAVEGCVLTKLDESASLGEAISLLIDHELPLTYVTDGQSVPDDISVIKAHQLVARSMAVAKEQQLQSSSLAN